EGITSSAIGKRLPASIRGKTRGIADGRGRGDERHGESLKEELILTETRKNWLIGFFAPTKVSEWALLRDRGSMTSSCLWFHLFGCFQSDGFGGAITSRGFHLLHFLLLRF
ncbi:MAG: hypothetical protein ACREQ5_11835, partial [Candidatus Dormibacteria bacterium]